MPKVSTRTCFVGTRGKICARCRKTSRSKATHEARVQATYGLGPGEYDILLAAQGGACAICKQTRKTRLDVDHCHKTGLVRGLCCARCNRRVLPFTGDDPQVLRNAADYLENFPALTVLGKRYHMDTKDKA